MTQGRNDAGRGPGGPHGQPGADRAQGARFRGDMDSERTDGGFLPVDPQDDYRSSAERDRSAGRPGEHQAERFAGEEHRDYRAWRDEQMRQLDDEYDAYLTYGHRHHEFSNQFETWLRDKLSGRTDYAGQNDKIGATPVEFGGQNATNSGFTRTDDE